MVYFITYLWIISTSVMFIIGFNTLFLSVCIMVLCGTSFYYGTLLILFSMLLISVIKSYYVSCLPNSIVSNVTPLRDSLNLLFRSVALLWFTFIIYTYIIVSEVLMSRWDRKKVWNIFYMLPWPCAFGMIILKEGSPPLLVQMVRHIAPCILTQKCVDLWYSLWLSKLLLYRL